MCFTYPTPFRGGSASEKIHSGSFRDTFQGVEQKNYDRRIFDNQLIFIFVSFTIIFIVIKTHERVS